MKSYCALLAALVPLILLAPGAQAQENYPDRTVTIIVTFPAGQAADIVARLLAEHLAKKWKQAVIVENKAGGLSVPGMMAGRNAKADGYTLTLAPNGALALNPGMIRNLPYDPIQDYAFVGGVFTVPYVIVAKSDSRFATVSDIVAAAKAEPGKISWGASGVGQRLSIEWFKQMTKTEAVSVPYKGSAQGLTDLLGGQIPLMTDSLSPVLSQIRAGKLKALAVMTTERNPQIPDTPTVAEQGYPMFSSSGWAGIVVPKATPAHIVDKISADLRQAMLDPDLKREILSRGAVPDPRGAGDWAAFVKSEVQKWSGIMKSANIHPE